MRREAKCRRSSSASNTSSTTACVAERCSQLAARLFKAAGTAGIAAELPFGRIYNDISVARQHISNQYEQAGKSFGAMLFGLENNRTWCCSEAFQGGFNPRYT